jgi:hypothetical protein
MGNQHRTTTAHALRENPVLTPECRIALPIYHLSSTYKHFQNFTHKMPGKFNLRTFSERYHNVFNGEKTSISRTKFYITYNSYDHIYTFCFIKWTQKYGWLTGVITKLYLEFTPLATITDRHSGALIQVKPRAIADLELAAADSQLPSPAVQAARLVGAAIDHLEWRCLQCHLERCVVTIFCP